MISIVMPMDDDRFEQFANTKRVYDSMAQEKEIIIPTRRPKQVLSYLQANDLGRDVKVVPYVWDHGFNPAHALNLGVRSVWHDSQSVIITCPEVRPFFDVLDRLGDYAGANVVCQVWNLDEEGNRISSLVNSGYRFETPGFYFLAMYNISDIWSINGWDERFMAGHAHEDEDFGNRWVRAGLPFEVVDEIQGEHQYHPPHGELEEGANEINWRLMQENNQNMVTWCERGISG